MWMVQINGVGWVGREADAWMGGWIVGWIGR